MHMVWFCMWFMVTLSIHHRFKGYVYRFPGLPQTENFQWYFKIKVTYFLDNSEYHRTEKYFYSRKRNWKCRHFLQNSILTILVLFQSSTKRSSLPWGGAAVPEVTTQATRASGPATLVPAPRWDQTCLVSRSPGVTRSRRPFFTDAWPISSPM